MAAWTPAVDESFVTPVTAALAFGGPRRLVVRHLRGAAASCPDSVRLCSQGDAGCVAVCTEARVGDLAARHVVSFAAFIGRPHRDAESGFRRPRQRLLGLPREVQGLIRVFTYMRNSRLNLNEEDGLFSLPGVIRDDLRPFDLLDGTSLHNRTRITR